MEIDPFQILTHALGFLILLAILKRFAWGQILGVLEARRQQIAGQFQEQARARVVCCR
jgi:F0F1-type ATP synthase membrane subunit b/b'